MNPTLPGVTIHGVRYHRFRIVGQNRAHYFQVDQGVSVCGASRLSDRMTPDGPTGGSSDLCSGCGMAIARLLESIE